MMGVSRNGAELALAPTIIVDDHGAVLPELT
jgi:hypothetical protein